MARRPKTTLNEGVRTGLDPWMDSPVSNEVVRPRTATGPSPTLQGSVPEWAAGKRHTSRGT